MKKIILTGAALLFPAFSYAATVPTINVVNHTTTGVQNRDAVVKIPLGHAATLVRAAPSAALVQTHDDEGQVTQSSAAIVKPLFIEYITAKPGKTAQGKQDVVVTVTYTFNYTLGVATANASGTQENISKKQNSYTRTVTTNVPYGHVEIVKLSLPPGPAGQDAIMQKLFPADMYLTISASK